MDSYPFCGDWKELGSSREDSLGRGVWGKLHLLTCLLLMGLYWSFCHLLTHKWLAKYVHLYVRPEFSEQRDHRGNKHTLEIFRLHFLVLSGKEGCEKAHLFIQWLLGNGDFNREGSSNEIWVIDTLAVLSAAEICKTYGLHRRPISEAWGQARGKVRARPGVGWGVGGSVTELVLRCNHSSEEKQSDQTQRKQDKCLCSVRGREHDYFERQRNNSLYPPPYTDLSNACYPKGAYQGKAVHRTAYPWVLRAACLSRTERGFLPNTDPILILIAVLLMLFH